MKFSRSQLKQMIKEETEKALSELSPQEFRKMDPRTAMRVSGGDDRSLRRAIADFITTGGEDRAAVLAKSIGDYEHSNPHLVILAQKLLARNLAKATPEERTQVAQSVNREMTEALLAELEEASKKKDKKDADPYERSLEAPLAEKDDDWIGKAVDPDHKGDCTPMTKSTCTPPRKALAKRFKKAAKKKDKEGGTGWQGKV